MALTAAQADDLFAHLKQLGATVVHAEYSGGGDSGQFDGFSVFDADGALMAKFNLDKPLGEEEALRKVTARLTSQNDQEFTEYLEQLAWDAIDDAGHNGFWNNEGGQGKLVINVSERTVVLEHDNYITETVSSEHTVYSADPDES